MSSQHLPADGESIKGQPFEKLQSDSHESAARLWSDIRIETGLRSYHNYVSIYKKLEDRSDLELLWNMMDDSTSVDVKDTCSIVDVLRSKGSPLTMALRCHSSSGIELLTALRQPPGNAQVQIILWPIMSPPLSRSFKLSREIYDMLGLGLRVDPQFFLALIETLRGFRLSDLRNEAIETRPLYATHVVVDRAVAYFVQCDFSDNPDAVPILLIAGEIDLGRVMRTEGQWDFSCVADQRLCNTPPFRYPTHVGDVPTYATEGQVDPKWLRIYMEIFSRLVESGDGAMNRSAALVLGPLLPLLYMNNLKMRARFLRLRRRYLALQAATYGDKVDYRIIDQVTAELHQERFWLRRSVEDSEDGMNHFETYVGRVDMTAIAESPAYQIIKEEARGIHIEARRLDAEVRDYLQLIVGNLSLEESRKSIELSDRQIGEGKRVKIFTVLAFVYIPLNLSTSIFGMNLQQLNQTGQNIWVFILTGVVALIITAVSWFCVEVFTSYKAWDKLGRTKEFPDENLVFRLGLIVWLIKNGHTTWMRRSGAGLCILTNNRFGKFRARAWQGLGSKHHAVGPDNGPEKAYDYVYRSIQSRNIRMNFDLRTIS